MPLTGAQINLLNDYFGFETEEKIEGSNISTILESEYLDTGSKILYLERAIDPTLKYPDFLRYLDKLYNPDDSAAKKELIVGLIGDIKSIRDMCFNEEIRYGDQGNVKALDHHFKRMGAIDIEETSKTVKAMILKVMNTLIKTHVKEGITAQRAARIKKEASIVEHTGWRDLPESNLPEIYRLRNGRARIQGPQHLQQREVGSEQAALIFQELLSQEIQPQTVRIEWPQVNRHVDIDFQTLRRFIQDCELPFDQLEALGPKELKKLVKDFNRLFPLIEQSQHPWNRYTPAQRRSLLERIKTLLLLSEETIKDHLHEIVQLTPKQQEEICGYHRDVIAFATRFLSLPRFFTLQEEVRKEVSDTVNLRVVVRYFQDDEGFPWDSFVTQPAEVRKEFYTNQPSLSILRSLNFSYSELLALSPEMRKEFRENIAEIFSEIPSVSREIKKLNDDIGITRTQLFQLSSGLRQELYSLIKEEEWDHEWKDIRFRILMDAAVRKDETQAVNIFIACVKDKKQLEEKLVDSVNVLASHPKLDEPSKKMFKFLFAHLEKEFPEKYQNGKAERNALVDKWFKEGHQSAIDLLKEAVDTVEQKEEAGPRFKKSL